MSPTNRRRFLLAGLSASVAKAGAPHSAFFLPNRGQFAERGSYCADLPRWRGVFAAGRASFRAKRLLGDPGPLGAVPVRSEAVSFELQLAGASGREPVGEDRRQGRSDFFFHGDPKTFVQDLPHFYRLRYPEPWPGVDLLVRVWEQGAELTPVVTDVVGLDRLAFRWLGETTPRTSGGGIALSAPWGVVRQTAPRIGRRRISGAYRMDSSGLLRFVQA